MKFPCHNITSETECHALSSSVLDTSTINLLAVFDTSLFERDAKRREGKYPPPPFAIVTIANFLDIRHTPTSHYLGGRGGGGG